MKWVKVYREDGRVEAVCEHGCGHPVYVEHSSLFHHAKFNDIPIWKVHGCDYCCERKDFPKAKEWKKK